jgi:hypothetical protein
LWDQIEEKEGFMSNLIENLFTNGPSVEDHLPEGFDKESMHEI